MNKLTQFISLILVSCFFISCSNTTKLVYFSNQKPSLDTLDSTKAYTIQRVQKSDRLNITISSTDPSLTAFLNPFGIISNNTNVNYFYKDLFVNVNLSGKVYIINGTEGSSIPINNERLTILEAMALSGQKSDINPKNDVWVIREDSGRRAYGKIDLTSRELFASPYFYLKSNDLIYIKPNPYSWIISQSSPVRLILSLIGSISALIILITKL